MNKKGYKELSVWQKANDLAFWIYKISNEGALSEDFKLKDQLRRLVLIIPSNLAEGVERGTDKESIRFFHFAKGSLTELRTQLQIAYEVRQIDKGFFERIDVECAQLGKMIGALIEAMTQV